MQQLARNLETVGARRREPTVSFSLANFSLLRVVQRLADANARSSLLAARNSRANKRIAQRTNHHKHSIHRSSSSSSSISELTTTQLGYQREKPENQTLVGRLKFASTLCSGQQAARSRSGSFQSSSGQTDKIFLSRLVSAFAVLEENAPCSAARRGAARPEHGHNF